MERPAGSLDHYFIMGQQKHRLFLIFSLGGKRAVTRKVGDVGELRQVLFALAVLLPALVESISKETSLGILGSSGEEGVDEHWLFAIFVASQP